MFEVYAFLLTSTLLAIYINGSLQKRTSEGAEINQTEGNGTIAFVVLLLLLIWFAGTRTQMNDTMSYLNHFIHDYQGTIQDIKRINWRIGDNPLFQVYLLLVKLLVSHNEHVFLLLTSGIVSVLMAVFLYRYAWNLSSTFYLFIVTTTFAFTMAAMKQSMASAIAIWAIPAIHKKRYIKAIFLIVLAMLFHTYVIVLALAFALNGRKVWDRLIWVIIGVTAFVCITFSSFIDRAIQFAGLFGDEYNASMLEEGTGIGIIRVLSSFILPFFAYAYREQLNEENNVFFDLCINLSIIASCFSVISGFGGAVLLGRIPNYFSIFFCISFPYVMYQGEKVDNNASIWAMLVYVAYIYYYHTYYNKYFTAWHVGFWGSVYNRISLGELFFGGIE